jgi:hypothetical protein
MHQSPALFDGVNNPPNGAYTHLLLPKRHRYPLFGVKTDDNHRFKHRPKVPNIIQGRQTQPNVFSNIVRSQKDRKYELIQAKIGLQSLFNVAAMDPAPGLSLCLSIVITIIESIDVSQTLLCGQCSANGALIGRLLIPIKKNASSWQRESQKSFTQLLTKLHNGREGLR